MREHTEQMALPRFLWVPFPLGRPFGAPHEPALQRAVLEAALALLERGDGPVVLEDFPRDAPQAEAPGDEAWACPVSFAPAPDARTPLVRSAHDELARLAPWHEVYAQQRGRSASSVTGVSPEDLVSRLGALAAGEDALPDDTALPLHEWLRLGCEELRTWYLEAAQGQPGRATPERLRAWFWRETAAARLIGAVTHALREHPEPMVRVLAARALVPREYMAALVHPDATPPEA